MRFLDDVCEDSKIKDIKTSHKFLFFVINVILIISIDNSLYSIINFILLTLLCVFLLKEERIILFKLLLIPLVFLIMGIIPILIQINNESYLYSFKLFSLTLGITQDSLDIATLTLFKALAITLCTYFLILNTNVNNIFNFMRKLKVPILIVNLFELTYRFIHVLVERTLTLKNAQESRVGYLNFRTSIQSFALMFKNIFINAFANLTKVRDAMDSRLYDNEINYYIVEEENSLAFGVFACFYIIGMLLIGWLLL
ncbi:MAG: cobalt ECF transporter T component CbiQ [Erysipelotrichales bacterium]